MLLDMRKSITLLLLMLGLGMGATAVKGQLMITEIMYRSPAVNGATDSLEYIEIFNNTSSPIDLTGYTLSGVTFGFAAITINPGEYVIPCRYGPAMQQYFGSLQNLASFSGGNLSNLGEAIVLKDGNGVTVDSVFYGNVAPWPTQGNGDGYSLTFCDRSLDNSNGANWSVSQTPGLFTHGIQLFADPNSCCLNVDTQAPTIVSASLSNYNRIGIKFSESVAPYSTWLDNFSANGSTIASASLGMTPDSIILMLSSPLADGQFEMIHVSGVQDLACNVMLEDSFEVVNNFIVPFLRVSEIMYDDPSVDDSLEFIEIFNRNNVAVELGGMRIAGSISALIPEISLPSLQSIVVARYPNTIDRVFGPIIPAIGWDSGTLGDQSGQIQIWNSAILIDSFTYRNTPFWPTGANGTGYSIKMCDETVSQDDPASWSLGQPADYTAFFMGDSIFATPTRRNCRTVGIENAVVYATQIHPNPFTTSFEIQTEAEEITQATVRDAIGRVVLHAPIDNGYAKIELGNNPAGIYFVNLQAADGSVLAVRKLIRL
jgi:hypothetical protein